MYAAVCVIFSLMMVASAGDVYGDFGRRDFYSSPSGSSGSSGGYHSGYSQHKPTRKPSLWEKFTALTRRSDLIGFFGDGDVGTILLVASIIFIGLILLAFAASVNLSGSGRSLDDDEWEIHHSDWLDTLQRDFEMQWTEK